MVAPSSPPTTNTLAAIVGVARFCVPAFVIVSGLVLSHGRRERPRALPFLQRRWTRVLAPWAFWTAVFLTVGLIRGEVPTNLPAAAQWLSRGPDHLYFLLLIAQLYLVMLVVPRRGRGLLAFVAIAFAVQLGLCWARTSRPVLHGALGWMYTDAAFEAAPFYVGYFAFGCLLGAEYERVRRLRRLWPVAALTTVLGGMLMFWNSHHIASDHWLQSTYAYLWPSRVPMTIAMVMCVIWGGGWVRQKLAVLWPVVHGMSRHSLGIYAFHVLVVTAAGTLTAAWPVNVRFSVMVAAAIAISYPVVNRMARSPLAWAVGESSAPAPGTVYIAAARSGVATCQMPSSPSPLASPGAPSLAKR